MNDKQINVGIIGHKDHKVTLSETITKILSFNNCSLVDNYSIDEEDNTRRITINTKNLSYQLQEQKRSVNDIEFDGSIILVSPEYLTKAREDILLSRQKGIPKLALLIDSSSEIEDKESLEQNLRELLNEYGYNGEDSIVAYANVDGLIAGDIDPNQDIKNSMLDILNSIDKKREKPQPAPYILPSRNSYLTNLPTIKKDKKEKKKAPVVKTKIYPTYRSRRGRQY